MSKTLPIGTRPDSAGADVSICIPAWQSEGIVERALRCASAQTYARVRILVSVDHSEDATAAVCQAHAEHDRRVDVWVQTERLGWAGNVNVLLSKVDTEFFFIYFHDDVILPIYTERLLAALREHPEAASVHCDMGHFGASQHVSIGRGYSGPTAQRLVEFLVVPSRGSPLRSLTRTAMMGPGFGLPTDGGGFWANEPYLMSLLAAGPAAHVPEVLYQRWDQRDGGLTDSWKRYTFAQVVSGYRGYLRAALSVLEKARLTKAEREVLVFCLYVRTMARVRDAEREHAVLTPTRPEDVNPVFADMRMPDSLASFGPQIHEWIVGHFNHLLRLEHRVAP